MHLFKFGITGTPQAGLAPVTEAQTQSVKLVLHHWAVIELKVSIPRRFMLKSLLFAICCSLVGDVITDRDVQNHQYTNGMQLHLAMRTQLQDCLFLPRVPPKQSAAQPRKVRGSHYRHCESAMSHRLIHTISMCRRCGSSSGLGYEGVGVVRNRCHTFHKHTLLFTLLCNHHVQAISVTSSINGVSTNATGTVPHGALIGIIQKLKWLQNSSDCGSRH